MCERKTSNLSSCVQGVREILMFFHNGKISQVTYISGGKSHLTLVHKFTNHAHLFGKIHASCIMHHKSHKNPLPSSLPSVMKEFLGNSSRS